VKGEFIASLRVVFGDIEIRKGGDEEFSAAVAVGVGARDSALEIPGRLVAEEAPFGGRRKGVVARVLIDAIAPVAGIVAVFGVQVGVGVGAGRELLLAVAVEIAGGDIIDGIEQGQPFLPRQGKGAPVVLIDVEIPVAVAEEEFRPAVAVEIAGFAARHAIKVVPGGGIGQRGHGLELAAAGAAPDFKEVGGGFAGPDHAHDQFAAVVPVEVGQAAAPILHAAVALPAAHQIHPEGIGAAGLVEPGGKAVARQQFRNAVAVAVAAAARDGGFGQGIELAETGSIPAEKRGEEPALAVGCTDDDLGPAVAVEIGGAVEQMAVREALLEAGVAHGIQRRRAQVHPEQAVGNSAQSGGIVHADPDIEDLRAEIPGEMEPRLIAAIAHRRLLPGSSAARWAEKDLTLAKVIGFELEEAGGITGVVHGDQFDVRDDRGGPVDEDPHLGLFDGAVAVLDPQADSVTGIRSWELLPAAQQAVDDAAGARRCDREPCGGVVSHPPLQGVALQGGCPGGAHDFDRALLETLIEPWGSDADLSGEARSECAGEIEPSCPVVDIPALRAEILSGGGQEAAHAIRGAFPLLREQQGGRG